MDTVLDLFIVLIMPCVFYFVFNATFFQFVSNQTGVHPSRLLTFGLLFVINFFAFTAFSVVQLDLIVNWTLIIVLFFFEIRIFYRTPWLHALCYALIGATVGLAINIFARSFFAMALNVPQSAFNNEGIGTTGNMKAFPVSIGFIGSALAFFLLDRLLHRQETEVICKNRSSRTFFLIMVACAFAYLCTVLVLYSLPSNGMVLKLWGVKAAISSALVVGLSFYFAYRSAYLIQCGEESRHLSKTIEDHRELNRSLHSLAIRDSLTGCYTRAYLEETLAAKLKKNPNPFGLAFIDLDSLKTVNDTFGHDAGNDYIVTVASLLSDFCHEDEGEYLCRYGGDEFIAVFPRLSGAHVQARLEEVAHRLRTENESGRFPFTLSISHGTVETEKGEDMASVISRADAAMYRNKKRTVKTGGADRM